MTDVEVKPAQIKTRSLPCPLTEDELSLKREEMVAAERTLTEAEGQESSQAESWKQRKKGLENDRETARAMLSIVATVVREKREFRDIEVVETKDHDRKKVDLVRVDTGEIIESRGMTPEELQRTLFSLRAVPDAVIAKE